jgi:hypothetical protein
LQGYDSDFSSGSKASSPVETTKVAWQFLNFTHPSEAKTSQHRKKVRSHVTKQQHQREQAITAAKRSQSYSQGMESEDLPPPQRTHASTFPSSRPNHTTPPVKTESPFVKTESPSPSASPSPTTQSPPHPVDLNDLYPEEWHPYVPRILVRITVDVSRAAFR